MSWIVKLIYLNTSVWFRNPILVNISSLKLLKDLHAVENTAYDTQSWIHIDDLLV